MALNKHLFHSLWNRVMEQVGFTCCRTKKRDRISLLSEQTFLIEIKKHIKTNLFLPQKNNKSSQFPFNATHGRRTVCTNQRSHNKIKAAGEVMSEDMGHVIDKICLNTAVPRVALIPNPLTKRHFGELTKIEDHSQGFDRKLKKEKKNFFWIIPSFQRFWPGRKRKKKSLQTPIPGNQGKELDLEASQARVELISHQVHRDQPEEKAREQGFWQGFAAPMARVSRCGIYEQLRKKAVHVRRYKYNYCHQMYYEIIYKKKLKIVDLHIYHYISCHLHI